MIDSIIIDNFRGIHRSKIDGLTQVNLFFGKNNCGKSSLLEALFLSCGQSNPLLPASINAMRAYTRLTETDIRYFFYQMDASSQIQIETSGSQERHLVITSFQEAAPVETGNTSTEMPKHYGLRMSNSNQREQKVRVDERYIEQMKCDYLSPRYDSTASVEGLQNIILNKD